jgi:predicted ArsR family transcriptional regulator
MNARRMLDPVDMHGLALSAPRTAELRAFHDRLVELDEPATTEAIGQHAGTGQRQARRHLTALESMDLAVRWREVTGQRVWSGVRREPLDLIPVAGTVKPALRLLLRWRETRQLGDRMGLRPHVARKRLRLEARRGVVEHDPETDRWRLASSYHPEVT